MNIRIALAAFTLAALGGAAVAAPKWNGAGWYVVTETDVGHIIDEGPYGSKEACVAVRPTDDAACMYLATQPTWDT